MTELETCPDCRARLPQIEGPAATHRYLGASAACWALYTAMLADEPPIGPTPALAQMVDAYAAQHPGVPSNQSIQSVAVHLLALYGVFVRGLPLGRLIWARQQALRAKPGQKHSRFHWLTPPDFTGSLTVADIAAAPTPMARAETAERYVRNVWEVWARPHAAIVATWYDAFIQKA